MILLLGIFSVPTFSRAAPEIGIQDSDITIDTIPSNPEPYADVTIQLSSYSTDLSRAMIQWRNGSSLVLSGYGKVTYSFKAPGPDSTAVFTVSIDPAEGGTTITKQVVISPSEIGLLWQAVDSYTPPFYRGKAFPSSEGIIKVVAIPTSTSIKQGKGNISYTWSTGDNNDAQTDGSGFNKDSFTFKNSQLHATEKVAVTATSVDGRYNAANTIDVPIVDPKIIFYKRSPTEGVLYNQGYTTEISVPEDEATIVAAPYNLALVGNENQFTYSWKINDEDIETPSKKTELTIHPTDHGGYATVDVVFENLHTLFQKVSAQVKLDL